MTPKDIAHMLLLAALWGGSFLFMRVAAPEFGPVALAAARVGGAALFLLPLLLGRGLWPELWRHRRVIFFVGLSNSGLPFLLYSYAALAVTAGLMSIFNATTPLWGALVAWLWLGDRPTPWRVVGLAIGFGGVAWLAWDKASFKAGVDGLTTGWAVLACLGATLLYGLSASATKRYLTGATPLVTATGSQIVSALVLIPLALIWSPPALPSAKAWGAAALLAVLCTSLAYILFFRLIARIGPANTIAVTFLIPAFAVLWGVLFLAEFITPTMVAGCAVILVGTALATGLVVPKLRNPPRQKPTA